MTAIPPMLDRVSDYAAYHAARSPEAVALSLDGETIGYGELSARVDRLARALLASGVGKGDRVAALQTSHPDYMVSFLAVASIGAIWLGLNPRYRRDELVYVVADAAPSVLLARSCIGERDYAEDMLALRDAAPSIRVVATFDGEPPVAGTVTMPDLLASGESVSAERLDAARQACGGRDPCLIVYTSGSTGRPKGALLHHYGIVAFARAQNALWPLTRYRVLNFLPINHIGCVVDISMPCLIAGGTMVMMEQFDPTAATTAIETERLTLWGSVPSVFALQVDAPEFATADLSSLELIVWEGAAMGEALIARLLATGIPLATAYGMTETTSAVAALPPTRDAALLAGSVGPAFPQVEVRLVDTLGGAVSDGEPGEVLARSPYNFLGYWKRPDETAQAFTEDGFLRTGDLAVRSPEGRYRIVGRLKEMFKSGGYNVYPREVEAVIEAHPAIIEAAVVGVPDALWGEVGVAFVTARTLVTPADMQLWSRERLANYKIPKRIIIERELPLLPIGKVDKQTLRRRAQQEDQP